MLLYELDFNEPPFTQYKFKNNLNKLNELILKNCNDNPNNNNGSLIYNNQTIKWKKINEFYIFVDCLFLKKNILISPIIFFDYDTKNLLFKCFNIDDLDKCIQKLIKFEYVLYNQNNNEINKTDLIRDKQIFVKNIKIRKEFEYLNEKIENKNFDNLDSFLINYNILSPHFSLITNTFLVNKEILFIMNKERCNFLKNINNFVLNDNKDILYIYGCDGIGKTLSLLYYVSCFNNIPILYFNLDLIFSRKNPKQSYYIFKKELFRKFLLEEKIDDEKIKKENINTLFQIYQNFLCVFENINKNCINENFDFWKILVSFIDNKELRKEFYGSVLIIDQYKNRYDKESKLSTIKCLLYENNVFKLILVSSINDTDVKKEFLNDLSNDEFLYYDDFYIKSDDESDNIEEKPTKDDLEKLNATFNVNTQFKSISLFEFEEEDKVENKEEKKNKIENEDKTTKEIEYLDKNGNKYKCENITNIIRQLSTDKIYINNLVSTINLTINNNNKNLLLCFKLFNYNCKYFSKIINLINQNKNQDLDHLINQFLNDTLEHMINKIYQYYLQNNSIKNSEYSIQKNINNTNEMINNLFILKNIIGKKINKYHLISYIKIFPLRYLKIIENKKENEYFFKLNNEEKKEYLLEYSFPFVKIVINQIIKRNQNKISINYDELSGSACGYYLKEKIQRMVENGYFFSYKKIERRFVWNFFELLDFSNEEDNDEINEDDIDDIDLTKFKKISYDDKKKNLLNNNNNYYIKPKSQTNKDFDSLFLKNLFEKENNKSKFIMILFQITKNKNNSDIKTKKDYYNSSLKVKQKIETIYNINITEIHFFYILGSELNEGNTTQYLKEKKIEFIFFSITKSIFLKSKDGKELNELPFNENSKIYPLSYEYDSLMNNYKKLDNLEHHLLLKKRKKEIENIDQNIYEYFRRKEFPDDYEFQLLSNDVKKIINFIHQINKRTYANLEITILYSFKVSLEEFINLKNYEDLFGIFYYKGYLIFLYNGVYKILNEYKKFTIKNMNIYKEIQDLISFNQKNKKINSTYILKEEIPNYNLEYIFIYKIYILNNEKN